MNLIEKAVARLEDTSTSTSTAFGQPGAQEHFKGIIPLNLGTATEADRIGRAAPKGRADPAVNRPAAPPEPVREISLANLQAQGLLTPEGRASALGREFRSIKSPILEKAFGSDAQRVSNGRRVMVSSALPGEGKTFCAINLAISIAATGDHKVLLIDADVVRPSVAARLGIQSEKGLSDVLSGDETDPLRIILQTSIDGLAVVPAGTAKPHAGEHLAANEMTWLLDRYSARFPETLMIIDSPPLLAVTETRSLLQRVGQLILVVAAGSTTREKLDAVLLQTAGGPDVSMILNKLPEAKSQFVSYYGY